MKFRHIISTAVALTVLGLSQTTLAKDIVFYQKASEATSPVSGNLAMRFTIKEDGSVNNIRITRSSGSQEVDSQAVSWMQTQSMSPATKNGQAIELSIVKEIKFSKTI
ncbi:energy transducer TonB [Neisseria weaveri]|uniref:TonB family C-terminal domain n=1 Tax=Neisseria weaveri TaxID=28091 RepID=A0A3S5C988_9NEIS|nr:energy transducer TonB [Neisseria weaveri]EGV37173.1 TonB protein [Neisseria weaveri ATCC 51223]EGV37233.1 TonB protein [Neisseria weaveri LMG 5135]SAY50985.1 TonB family C-terminal domain [Neisseria weaveri]VEJ49407.1 TonB family C-terminal domain [Neisseria weaveri]